MNRKLAKKRKMMRRRRRLIILCMLLFVLFIVYVWGIFHFSRKFLPKTTLNNIDVSGHNAEEVKELVTDEINTYVLTISERNGVKETIDGRLISLQPEFDGEVEECLKKQPKFTWITSMFKKKELNMDTMVSFDEAQLIRIADTLDASNDSLQVAPQDAMLSEYHSPEGFSVVPESYGNKIIDSVYRNALKNAVASLQENVDLDEMGCYQNPNVYSDDEYLNTLCDNLNSYANMSITYDMADTTLVVDGSTISQWLIVNGTDVYLSEEAVSSYVDELASTYNTAFHKRYLKTTYGETVEILGGDYGWKLDKDAEYQQILTDLANGKDVVRDMNWAWTANSHGENDYGDSYVEINLTAQHLFLYYKGEIVVETDFVSGNVYKGFGTPVGAYGLTYKEKDATLKGEDYETPVAYWMPFCNNVGMHDADWRSNFGGSIYMTSGSHGCVNCPPSKAGEIFEYVDTNYPVLVYELPGTGPSPDGTLATSVIDLINAIGPVTLESETAIKAARDRFEAIPDSAKTLVTNLQVLYDSEAALNALKGIQ